jgi:uncharacterized membrane protein YGL010W
MTPNAALTFALPILIFACGMALFSYRFYAAYHAWAFKEFGFRAHLPGILGTALMLFAILFAASLGWLHVAVTMLGGVAVSYLYVYVFRMWTGAALLGPVFAVLSILLIPA